MATLVDKITAPDTQPQVIEACVRLIDREVAGKGGLSGVAVKAGYKVIKTLKPSIIADAVANLVPDFAQALQPMYEASGGGEKFAAHLEANAEQAADLMLGVTDAKAARSTNNTIKKTYERLRKAAKKHVVEAVPGLGKTLSPFC